MKSLSSSSRRPCVHCGKSYEMSVAEMFSEGSKCPHCGKSTDLSKQMKAARKRPPSSQKRKVVLFLFLAWVAAIVVVGLKVSWGFALFSGFFGTFLIAVIIQKIFETRDRIKAYQAGGLTLTTTTRTLHMGERVDGKAIFTSKKAMKRCRIRIALDLEVRVYVGDSQDGRNEWKTFSSSRVELPDAVFDMRADETRTFPFSLDARIPNTQPSDKKSLLGRMMQDDESKAWAMTPQELISKYRTRWSLLASVAGITEEIRSGLILEVKEGEAPK